MTTITLDWVEIVGTCDLCEQVKLDEALIDTTYGFICRVCFIEAFGYDYDGTEVSDAGLRMFCPELFCGNCTAFIDGTGYPFYGDDVDHTNPTYFLCAACNAKQQIDDDEALNLRIERFIYERMAA